MPFYPPVGAQVAQVAHLNMLQQNSRGGYRVIGGRNKTHSKGNAPLAPLTPLGADPYDTEERLAIQQEGNEISDMAKIDAVPSFDDVPNLTAEQHGAIQRRCMGLSPDRYCDNHEMRTER